MATSCLGNSYVEYIDKTECIGNSLRKINDNFSTLDQKTCEIEGTISELNSVEGILKGDGLGNFWAASPITDYYVPGTTMYSDLIITGKFNCGNGITVATGSVAVLNGNVRCLGLTTTGPGTIGGALVGNSSLTITEQATIGGALAANSLNITNNGIFNGSLDVTKTITGSQKVIAIGSVETPLVTVTGNDANITTKDITIARTLNAGNTGVISNLYKANVDTAVVQMLTAFDGVFLGTRANIGITTTSRLTADVGNIESFKSPLGAITTINNSTFNGNVITLTRSGLQDGTITSPVAVFAAATITNLNVPSTITAPVGNLTTVNSTDVNTTRLYSTDSVRTTTLAASSLKISAGAVIDNITVNTIYPTTISGATTIGATTGNITTVNATTVNATGSMSNHGLTVTGAASITGTATVGGVDASGTVSAQIVTARGDIIAYYSSDSRLKLGVTKITNALDKVSSIKGVEYTWDETLQKTQKGKDIGVIAQDVEQVYPEIVTTKEDGYKAVRYERLIPLLIEAVKELKDQNAALRTELDLIKAKL